MRQRVQTTWKSTRSPSSWLQAAPQWTWSSEGWRSWHPSLVPENTTTTSVYVFLTVEQGRARLFYAYFKRMGLPSVFSLLMAMTNILQAFPYVFHSISHTNHCNFPFLSKVRSQTKKAETRGMETTLALASLYPENIWTFFILRFPTQNSVLSDFIHLE